MADTGKSRLGRPVMAVLAALSFATFGCGSSSPLPSIGDGSMGGDASTKGDAAAKTDTAGSDAGTRSDAGGSGDAMTGSDALPPLPDGGSLDAGLTFDGGPCPVPLAPDLSVIASDEVLKFVAPGGLRIEVAVVSADAAISRAVFQPGSSLSLAGLSGPTRVLARTTATGCIATDFDAIYDVRATYPPAPPDPTTTAIGYSDARIVNWAQAVASYLPGTGVSDPKWMMPSQAFGPAGTDTTAVVVLGNAGTITLTFDPPITDGDGWDFAVFENSFASDLFLELGFVEVSSDGSHFTRFDSAFRGPTAPCGSCSGTAAEIGGLAGSYMVGYGTPFDLGGPSQRSSGARRLRRSGRHQVRPHCRHRRRRDDARLFRARDCRPPLQRADGRVRPRRHRRSQPAAVTMPRPTSRRPPMIPIGPMRRASAGAARTIGPSRRRAPRS